MGKILITEPIHEKGLSLLNNKVEIVGPDEYSAKDLLKLVPELSGVIVRAFRLPEEAYKKGVNLKVISKHGTGVDNINIPLATEKGIIVTNTAGSNSNAVAEYTIALMMNISRRVCLSSNIMYEVANGHSKRDLLGNELASKRLGILGVGNIGSRIAYKCKQGLGMDVLGFDPYLNREQAEKIGITIIPDKDEILRQADYISLNLPLNEQTHNYISLKELRLMKNTAYLINTSRGGIINEEDLALALNDGLLGGAAIDVLSSEPPKQDNPLLKARNILLTPHIAAQSEEAMVEMAVRSAQHLLDVLEGRKPDNILNPEVFGKKNLQ
jgi:D-3-phosphoglycerate dehydrogenase